jgi:glycosyltransferase involved in cell wall biosynthesis
MSDRPLVALCMIVRNEAANLPRCLASVAGVVDELVIVDTGSTDDTVAIARAAGALVVHEPWADDFAAARNAALPHVGAAWVLQLDADEVLDADTAASLRPWLDTTTADAGQCVVRNLQPPEDLLTWMDSQIVRVFRNRPGYRWEGRIHEQVGGRVRAEGGSVALAPFRIVHHGYTVATVQGGTSRALRNLPLLQQHVEDRPHDPFTRLQLADCYKAAGHDADAEAAYRAALALDRDELKGMRASAHYRLAQLLLARDAHEDAWTHADAALGIDPDNLPAHQVAGIAALSLGRVGPALRALEAVLVHPQLRAAHRGDIEALVAFCRRHVAA